MRPEEQPDIFNPSLENSMDDESDRSSDQIDGSPDVNDFELAEEIDIRE